MSRIGRKPIELPSGVMVALSPGRVQVNGPLGELSQVVPARMQIEKRDEEVVVTRPTERGEDRALHGLTRTLIANMVEGVTKGFEKHLEIQGVGYRAQLKGTDLELAVGFSHPVTIKPRAESPSTCRRRPRSSSRASTSRPSGRPPPRSQVGRPSRTRARASATATSRSAGRSGSARERDDETPGAYAPPSPGSEQDRRDRGATSSCSVPLEPRDLRAARRRLERAHARGSGLELVLVVGVKTEQASAVGKALGQAAKKAGIERCVFDRGGYLYHGRVKALAEGAREEGLKF